MDEADVAEGLDRLDHGVLPPGHAAAAMTMTAPEPEDAVSYHKGLRGVNRGPSPRPERERSR
jgi:hypothetical protein